MWFFKKTRRRITTLSKILNSGRELIGTRILIKNHKIIKDYSYLVYFTVGYSNSPMPSTEEWDRFDLIQDSLDELAEKLEFYNPAIITINGKRDWIIYTQDGQSLMAQLQLELGHFSPQMECQFDPTWSQYREIRSMK